MKPPEECCCLHGFGPCFVDGGELSACPAHPMDVGAVAQIDRCLCALADVVELVWPPGFDRPDDAALAARSEVLAEIMERLAFLKPRDGAK